MKATKENILFYNKMTTYAHSPKQPDTGVITYTKVSASEDISWKKPAVNACALSERFGNV
jgi:hypothetical protein